MKNSTKGVSIYLSLMIMSGFLVLALGISAISFSQAQIIKEMANSVFSFYAAESGIERALYEMKGGAGGGSQYEDSFENGASYVVNIEAHGENCPALNFCVKSVGMYKNTRRAIQIGR